MSGDVPEESSPENCPPEDVFVSEARVHAGLASEPWPEAIDALEQYVDSVELALYRALVERSEDWPSPEKFRGAVPYSRACSVGRAIEEMRGLGYRLVTSYPDPDGAVWRCSAEKDGPKRPGDQPVRAVGFCRVSALAMLLVGCRSREWTGGVIT